MVNGICMKKGRFMKKEDQTFLFRIEMLLLIVMMLSFTGCGNWDDDDDDVKSTDTISSGIFEGGPVSGLAFTTATQAGTTDEEGFFSYKQGETVTFAIGDLVLGSTAGKDEVSPIDLVAGAQDGSDPAVNNICVLLQSLDQDGHLNNGIQITDDISAIVGKYALNFNQAAAAFAADADVIALLAELNTAGVFSDTDQLDRTLRTARNAIEFLARCLSERNTVVMQLGMLRGYSADETTWQYLGIPYAKPPIGDLRWRAPQPAEAWEGVRQAIAWGDQAPQNPAYQPYGEGGMSEDCLYLNITAPKGASDLPVMVWFHGGAFTILTGNTKGYNNVSSLPTQGVVLVTVVHRLGPFGYISHPDLADETQYHGSGNYGQLDLVEALKWVQSNISAFGGDPHNVTIFGQSGGGGKTASLMTSELSKGLFHKAIIMAGTSVLDKTTTVAESIANEEAKGQALFDRIGATSLEQARALSWKAIIDAEIENEIPRETYRPSIDNYYLTDTYYNTIVTGQPAGNVPLLIGCTAGDYPTIVAGVKEHLPLRYDHNEYNGERPAIFLYKFNRVPTGWAKMGLLSNHGGEIPYLFNDPATFVSNYLFRLVSDPLTGGQPEIPAGTDVFTSLQWGAEDEAMVHNTMMMWANFAKTGDPSIPGVDWPAYTNENEAYVEIGQDDVAVKYGLDDAFTEGSNAAWLRQQLGDDGDPTNGSEIADDIITIASLYTINYHQTSEDFQADDKIVALLEDVAEYRAHAAGARNTVETIYGPVSGYEANEDTWQYLGIPYAKPPVGDLRWRPPQPPEPWEGVRDALYWGDQAAQNPASRKYGEGDMSEDCLYLNVTAPKEAANYPVMVWFHGGGFTALTANSMDYNNPDGLPTRGVVQVSVNHRLGFFGYLAHPWLSAEAQADPERGYYGSGNYGQMDLIAALEWVQDNIAAFGGDPNNVTIFGESGGGRKTLSLMASPEAAGLFHKAISQSGTLYPNTRSLEAAEAEGLKLSDALGGSSIDELRAIPWPALVAAAAAANVAPYTNVDGGYLPVTERERIESGDFNDVPFIMLITANDMSDPIGTWKDVLPWLTDNSQSNHYATLFTKVPGGWQDRGVSAYHACELSYVHGYPESLIGHYQLRLVIDPATGAPLVIDDLNGNSITGSAGDVEDIWTSAGWDEDDTLVVNTVMTLWANFAKTGDPSIPGIVEWTPYTRDNDLYLEIGVTPEMRVGQSELTFLREPAEEEEE